MNAIYEIVELKVNDIITTSTDEGSCADELPMT